MEGWWRTYWAVFGANLVTSMGTMSFLPFFPTVLQDLGVEGRASIATWTGLVFGAAPLAAGIMGPIWGSLGDRYGRKLMVLRALVAISIFVGAMSLARTPLQLLLLRLGQGTFSGFVPPGITLVSIAAPRELQGRVAGTLQSSLAAGSLLGPLVGDFLQRAYGMRSVFVFVACASALGALGILLFAEEDASLREAPGEWSPGSLLFQVARDFRELLRKENVRRALLLLFLVQLGVGSTNPLLLLHVQDVLSGGATPVDVSAAVGEPALGGDHVGLLTALLFTTLSVATLVTTPLWGRRGDRRGHGRSLRSAAAAAAVGLVLHALATSYAVLLGARLVLGLGVAGTNAGAYGTAAVETSTERRGAAMGSMFSARHLAVSLGSIGGGVVARLAGIEALFWGGGIALLLALLLTSRRG